MKLPDPESATYWLQELSSPPHCPICAKHGCKRERYAVTLLDPGPNGFKETMLVHAEDKEDAFHFACGMSFATGMQVIEVKYRGGGA